MNQNNSLESQEKEISLDTIENVLGEQKTPQTQTEIFDINLNGVSDVVAILQEKKYDFAVIEPGNESVKISFKKSGNVVESKLVRFPAYMQMLLQVKTSCKLNIENTTEEQKGTGILSLNETNIPLIVKTVPTALGEQIFIKMAPTTQTTQGAASPQKKKGVDTKTALTFIGVLLTVALILGGGFLSFVVFNAKTLQDVSLFYSLGINLNQINSFLLTASRIVFSVLVFFQTLLLIFFLFRALLTKKEQKRKKTVATILSIFLFILTFATASFWLVVEKKISSLPNWLEMSYGNVQVYDNALLGSDTLGKEDALIADYTNIIGPVELKFDLNYYAKEQARLGFTIQKYIWKINNKSQETSSSEFLYTFSEMGTYDISLSVTGIDRTGKVLEKVVTDVPNSVNIRAVVDVKETTTSNGGKTYKFDASRISNLGKIEWYFPENTQIPAYVGPIFQPSKVYFEDSMIGMIIRNNGKSDNTMDKIFLIKATENEITGEITHSVSADNDLTYNFSAKDIELGNGNGFIESFTWIIEGKEKLLPANIEELESSSKITHTFSTYGKQTIRLKMKNSAGQEKTILKEINIPKKLALENQIEFLIDNGVIPEVEYKEDAGDYYLYELGTPTRISFDASKIRADNLLYTVESVAWDVDGDGANDATGKTFQYDINTPGDLTIVVHYSFKHRRNSEDIIPMSQRIYIESKKKEAEVILSLDAQSEYAPTTVSFDASRSKVQNDNIVKFIYDYGDGNVEERDAKNLAHRYLKEGTYTIKLTVVTEKGKEYSTTKNLVLKPQPIGVVMKSSLSSAPVDQEISFSSAGTQGQIARYNWDFGDGSYSTEANPSYAYKKPGKYTVTLTLDFMNNNSLSEKLEVEIYEKEE